MLGKHLEVALVDVGISLPQYRLLAFLSGTSPTASRLADLLVVSRPSVTALVDGLVARGLVDRQHATDDRRQVIHRLTDAGESTLVSADDAVRGAMHDLLSCLEPAQQDLARQGLRLLAAAIDRQCEAHEAGQ